MALFQKGHPGGGRTKGARNRIAYKLIEALEKDFQEHGEEAIKIARIEEPVQYLRIVASLLPKEFELEISDNRLHDIPDDELDALLEYARRRIAARGTDEREEQAPVTH